MKRLIGEKQKAGNAIKSLAALGVLGITLAGCGAQVSDKDTQAAEFSATNFTYDHAVDLGRIAATEEFETPVTDEQAATSMEENLNNSRFEFQNYFPNIPLRVLSGTINCHVIGNDDSQKEFNLICDVMPTSVKTFSV